ncbi:lactonase family protein [Streptococcus dentiloxodontae]
MSYKLFLGTYTKRCAKGIYSADFDQTTGQISNLNLEKSVSSPTYLTQAGDDWYSVFAENGKAGVQKLTGTDKTLEAGPQACHISADADNQYLFTANYHTGLIHIYSFNERLKLIDTITHNETTSLPEQPKAHPHFAGLTPDKLLVTCDLGTDRLETYTLDSHGKAQALRSYQTAHGSGPRHILFHPYHKLAYLVCELSSEVQVLIYDGYGQFEPYQSLSTLPQNKSCDNASAAIQMTRDGRFLYVSNRGHNSIACYAIGLDGYLKLLDIIPSHGQIPRDMTLSPDDSYLLVGNQESDNISIFKRLNDGKLQLLSADFQVPEPTCLVFEQ